MLTPQSIWTFHDESQDHLTDRVELLQLNKVKLNWHTVMLICRTYTMVLQFDEVQEASIWAQTVINAAQRVRSDVAQEAAAMPPCCTYELAC